MRLHWRGPSLPWRRQAAVPSLPFQKRGCGPCLLPGSRLSVCPTFFILFIRLPVGPPRVVAVAADLWPSLGRRWLLASLSRHS